MKITTILNEENDLNIDEKDLLCELGVVLNQRYPSASHVEDGKIILTLSPTQTFAVTVSKI
jgi:hypothetical protein